MRSENADGDARRPFIDLENVQATLDSLIYPSTSTYPNALYLLTLVDIFLANPDLPQISNAREFALQHVLVSLIREEYAYRRQSFGLPAPDDQRMLAAARNAIVQDAQTSASNFIGWSSLYYRYVRVDLEITPKAYATTVKLSERTVYRYQLAATLQLKDRLAIEEWNARTQYRHKRLLTSLPRIPPTQLVGRESAFAATRQALTNENKAAHFQIIGPSGIGKTAFAQEFIRQQIESAGILQLVWLNNPPSVSFVRHQLMERILSMLENSAISLREYTLLHKCAVVLDGIDALASEITTFEELLDDLSAALVLLTGSNTVALRNIENYIVLRELDEAAIEAFIHARHVPDVDKKGLAAYLWQRVGGNPLALILTLNQLDTGVDTDKQAAVHSVEGLLDRVYDALDDELRLMWLALAFFPAGDIRWEDMQAIWGHAITSDDAQRLVDWQVLELTEGDDTALYRLPAASRRYLQERTRDDTSADQLVSNLIGSFVQRVNEISADVLAALSIVEHILLTGWPAIDANLQIDWIHRYWREGLRRGRWAHWYSILEAYAAMDTGDNAEITIAYGICLRQLGEWQKSVQVFETVRHVTGQQGQFVQQAAASLELARVQRYQGKFQQATQLIQQVESTILRLGDAELKQALIREKAQTALDVGDGSAAEIWLRELPETAPFLALRAEAFALKRQYAQAREFAQQSLTLASDNPALVARMQALIGRCYEREENFDHARYYLALAITLFEQQEDIFALARARTNLGALLLRTGELNEAALLLHSAEFSQVHFGDKVALATTRYNLRLLRTQLHPN